jgi:hypothetical protein
MGETWRTGRAGNRLTDLDPYGGDQVGHGQQEGLPGMMGRSAHGAPSRTWIPSTVPTGRAARRASRPLRPLVVHDRVADRGRAGRSPEAR